MQMPDNFHFLPQAEIEDRIQAGIDQWLLMVPRANPGILEMMRLRDRQPPYENPEMWAGEFIGKYLLSAVLTLHLTDDPRLEQTVRETIDDLIATQADDGYMGPWPRDQRLLGQWDLWGHYHIILALHTWHQDTGDRDALNAATRAADLICRTYLDTDRRVLDAGWAEMNMAILHGLGLLHRETENERYVQLMMEIVEDWQKPGAGDYYRQAVAGKDFFLTPKPRWESLHSLQGFTELYRITGDPSYRDALLHYWHSIHTTDVHNNGSFSVGEGAVGNPFRPGAIETCCTVAWIALSVDALSHSQDSRIADALENSLWNAVRAYQHPSGRWSTYNTPMEGKREASADTISNQLRPGTPELTCCSVNAPRGFSELAQWALMENPSGLFLNYYGPGQMQWTDAHGVQWTLTQESDYPIGGKVLIRIAPEKPTDARLHLRIPEWSEQTKLMVNGDATSVEPGTYHAVERTWQDGDTLELHFDMSLRTLRGDQNVNHRTSLYHGPLLLAYDQHDNPFDPPQIPTLDAQQIDLEPVNLSDDVFPPVVAFAVTGPQGERMILRDFGSAGATGTYYTSWLPVENSAPGRFYLEGPRYDRELPPSGIQFTWSSAAPDARYTLTLASDPAMTDVILKKQNLAENHWQLDQALSDDGMIYWHVSAENAQGAEQAFNGPWPLKINQDLKLPEDGIIVRSPLDGSPEPERGTVARADNLVPAKDRHGQAEGALAFNGADSRLAYNAPIFLLTDLSFMAWVRPAAVDENDNALHQVVSAWCRPADDPLRVTLHRGELSARVEAGAYYSTEGYPLESDRWYHVAAVRQGDQLRLFVDGEQVGATTVAPTATHADALGVGSNPHFDFPESFHGAIDEALFVARALTPEEIKAAAQAD